MNVVDEPAAFVRPDDVEGRRRVASAALQLDAVGALVVFAGDGLRTLDDAIAVVRQINLKDRDALLELVGLHVAYCRPTLAAPQPAHPIEVVGLHGGHELRHRVVHRLGSRCRVMRSAGEAARGHEHGNSSQQQEQHLSGDEVTRR